ncbi:UNVERIFIED_CONTAM: vacuolar transporter chaperone [Siphonaria sp. JEL0065]|nr:vacuolar transporter chaperone [Siphonaria sp. JEL0065]
MKFGARLLEQRQPEWEYYYINYELCKRFLKNTGSRLSELDEAAFVEILDRELEKVASFRKMKGDELRRRVAKAERSFALLQTTHPTIAALVTSPVLGASPEETQLATLREQVSSILESVGHLSKYTRLNYAGFMKILKKHDRYTQFQLKPMFLLRMRERPFYEESVEPLVVRLSRIFNDVRTGGKGGSGTDAKENIPDKFVRKTTKYWVHYDKVDDLRNEILKKIPVLIVKDKKGAGLEDIPNPAVSTVYFDNENLEMYNDRLERKAGSQLIRLRWYGDMDANDIFVERKVLKVKKHRHGNESSDEDGDEEDETTAGATPAKGKRPASERNLEDERTEKSRFTVKEMFVNAFLAGKHQMDKSIQKVNEKVVLESITSPSFSPAFSSKSPGLPAFTSPSLVATTSRTAIPSKSRLQDLVVLSQEIRETIKERNLKPILRTFYNRTAFQIPGDLRVRISLDTDLTFIREDNSGGVRRSGDNWRRTDCGASWPFDYLPKEDVDSFPYAVLEVKIQMVEGGSEPEWVKKLVRDNLIIEVPTFSKYIHGVSDLLDDKVNVFPPWIPLLDKDLRSSKRVQPSDLIGDSAASASAARPSRLNSLSTIVSESGLESRRPQEVEPVVRLGTPDVVGFQAIDVTKRIVIPVRIEPKVYFANERTFLTWLQFVISLCAVALGLLNFGDKVGQIAVASFRKMKGDELRRRVAKAERSFALLQTTHPTIAALVTSPVLGASPEETQLATLREQVSSILESVGHLSKYTRLNYAGFMKILKKHDRYTQFQLKPMFLLRMRERPFYEESVEPLVVRLSRIFNDVRTGGKGGSGTDAKENIPDKFVRKTTKYWVHYDKVDDLRNEILKKIPVLIVKDKKGAGLEDIPNPAVSTVYFDNENLEMYNDRLERKAGSQLIRLRWYGDMDANDIFVERKVLKVKKHRHGNESTDEDEEDETTAGVAPAKGKRPASERNLEDERTEKSRFTVKETFVNAFLAGKHQMDKSIQKVNEKVVLESITSPSFSPAFSSKSPGLPAFASPSLVATTSRTAVPSKSRLQDLVVLSQEIRETIKAKNLKPILRTFYNRTAFQIPGDLRVRISLDTELTFIREDNFGGVKRSGDNWRRTDCGASWPFDYLPKEDVDSFPYAVLEVKIQMVEGGSEPEWVKKLVRDNLIIEVPTFSKYIHGASDLLDDKVNVVPPWIPLLDKDLRSSKRVQPSDLIGDSAASASAARPSRLDSLSTIVSESGLESRRPQEVEPVVRLGTPDVVGFQAIDVTKRIVIPVRIEPKVYFANERTFLTWLQCAFVVPLVLVFFF